MSSVPTYLKGRGRGRGASVHPQYQGDSKQVQNSTGWARGFTQTNNLRGNGRFDGPGVGRGTGAVKKSYNQEEQAGKINHHHLTV